MSTLPPDLQQFVFSIGSLVTSEDVDTYARLRQIADASHRDRAYVEAWERQQSQETDLRRGYAKWLLFALFLQIGVVNAAFFLIGANVLQVERWVAASFILGVFGEVTSMTVLVIRYLFPRRGRGTCPGTDVRSSGVLNNVTD